MEHGKIIVFELISTLVVENITDLSFDIPLSLDLVILFALLAGRNVINHDFAVEIADCEELVADDFKERGFPDSRDVFYLSYISALSSLECCKNELSILLVSFFHLDVESLIVLVRAKSLENVVDAVLVNLIELAIARSGESTLELPILGPIAGPIAFKRSLVVQGNAVGVSLAVGLVFDKANSRVLVHGID